MTFGKHKNRNVKNESFLLACAIALSLTISLNTYSSEAKAKKVQLCHSLSKTASAIVDMRIIGKSKFEAYEVIESYKATDQISYDTLRAVIDWAYVYPEALLLGFSGDVLLKCLTTEGGII